MPSADDPAQIAAVRHQRAQDLLRAATEFEDTAGELSVETTTETTPRLEMLLAGLDLRLRALCEHVGLRLENDEEETSDGDQQAAET